MLKVLADRPDVQEKLRQELNKLEAEPSVCVIPSFDARGNASSSKSWSRRFCLPIASEELNACAYLEAFVREGLRLFPPVASTGRVSLQDDLIPLSEPIPGRDGKLIEHIAIPKGTFILIPAIVINKSKEMFGKDASEFKSVARIPSSLRFDEHGLDQADDSFAFPSACVVLRPERWLPSAEKPVSNPLEVPWGNQMTFIAGPRACIGYRFALLEIKTILFALVRSLAFSHVSSALKFEAKQTLVMRPNIVGRVRRNFF
jgi:cytochrome P450